MSARWRGSLPVAGLAVRAGAGADISAALGVWWLGSKPRRAGVIDDEADGCTAVVTRPTDSGLPGIQIHRPNEGLAYQTKGINRYRTRCT